MVRLRIILVLVAVLTVVMPVFAAPATAQIPCPQIFIDLCWPHG